MKSFQFILLIGIIITLLSVIILYFFGSPLGIIPLSINSTNITELDNVTITPGQNSTVDMSIEKINNTIPSIDGDTVFNNINWSKYPNVEKIGVHENRIAGPNSLINHQFSKFTIDVNVKDPENLRELFRELAGIVIEIRQRIGPNSSISVVGLVNGIYSFSVDMLPYDDRLYASDNYHPNAYKNDIYLIPGDDIYDYHNYTLINNSVIEP